MRRFIFSQHVKIKCNISIINAFGTVFIWLSGMAQYIVGRFFLMSKVHNIVYLDGYRP